MSLDSGVAEHRPWEAAGLQAEDATSGFGGLQPHTWTHFLLLELSVCYCLSVSLHLPESSVLASCQK